MSDSVLFGIDRLETGDWSPPRGSRLALLANHASLSRSLRMAPDVVAEQCPGQLKALLTPQHGLWGEEQANMIESPHGHDARRQIPIYSLYSESRRPTASMLPDIDLLLVDLQDVGTRVYTFIWTLLECLRVCESLGVRVIVLDRPNPVGGCQVEGERLSPGMESFVGGAPIPMRHGLTIGEMAVWLVDHFGLQTDVEVVPLRGWRRKDGFPQDRHWTPPSPNLPIRTSCLVYPGQVLLEGTNLSEGRGTTRPFEMCGAPFIDPVHMADSVNALRLPGVVFTPTRFVPTFDKWAGESCGGVFLRVTDQAAFRPLWSTILLLAYVAWRHSTTLQWLPPPYEYETVKVPLDIISGSNRLRKLLSDMQQDGASEFEDILSPLETLQTQAAADAASWWEEIRPFLMYD